MKFKTFIFFVLPLLIISCAATSYKYYGLDLDEGSSGTLQSDDPKNNLDLVETCEKQGACVVLTREEFFKLARDFRETKKSLENCQRK